MGNHWESGSSQKKKSHGGRWWGFHMPEAQVYRGEVILGTKPYRDGQKGEFEEIYPEKRY